MTSDRRTWLWAFKWCLDHSLVPGQGSDSIGAGRRKVYSRAGSAATLHAAGTRHRSTTQGLKALVPIQLPDSPDSYPLGPRHPGGDQRCPGGEREQQFVKPGWMHAPSVAGGPRCWFLPHAMHCMHAPPLRSRLAVEKASCRFCPQRWRRRLSNCASLTSGRRSNSFTAGQRGGGHPWNGTDSGWEPWEAAAAHRHGPLALISIRRPQGSYRARGESHL